MRHRPAVTTSGYGRIWALGLALSLLCQGCLDLAQQSIVRSIGDLMAAGVPAYARETDLILAEPALAASIKVIEALLETAPHNPILLVQAAQGLASYTYAFVDMPSQEGRHDARQMALPQERARRLYRRALRYGLRGLSRYNPAWEDATSLTPAALTLLLRQLDTKAVPALFWTVFSWSNGLSLERAALETAAAVPRLQSLLDRLLQLDETYFYGAPHLLQGVLYASRSRRLGGDPSRARAHFTRARELSQRRLLLVPLLEAQYYAVQIQDRALFTTLLEDVLDAPEALLPEQAFLNTVAKQRAALLLQRINELFV